MAEAIVKGEALDGHIETEEDVEQFLPLLALRIVDSREVYRGRWERMGKGGRGKGERKGKKAKGWVKRVVKMR